MKKWLSLFVMFGFAVSCFCGVGIASELDEKIWEAGQVLEEYMQMPEQKIPKSLLANAKAIAIFPSMIKAGFILAGQYGEGVVLYKNDETGSWSAPAFFRMSGGSVGFQIGGEASDAILVITSERGVRGLLQNKFTLGADASVAAGPTGRDAEARTDWKMKSTVYSYSRSKGLFAGVSLDGVVINEEESKNIKRYGAAAEQVLLGGDIQPDAKGKKLIDIVQKYTS
jgi:lipid-binding SYLF domain-containing protein